MGHVKTGIKSFDKLFVGKDNESGIQYQDNEGIFGVLLGAAGTGKSIFGLHLCCGFLIEGIDRCSIFISQERPEKIKTKIIEDFTYFKSHNPNQGDDEQPFEIAFNGTNEVESLKDNCIHICQLDFDGNQQKNLIKSIFQAIENKYSPHERQDKIFICLDNTEMIDKGKLYEAIVDKELKEFLRLMESPDPSSYDSRQKEIIYYRSLRHLCNPKRINALFIFEEYFQGDIVTELSEISTNPPVHAADIAVHLGFKTYSSGYRERYLEIIKAKNQFYHRGRHHFSIVSRFGGGRPKDTSKDIGITIYHSIATQLYRLDRSRKKQDSKISYRKLGIKKLDQKIEEASYTSDNKGYILEGSSSVLVSDLDIKGTQIALHYANESSKAVYISFLHNLREIMSICEGFSELELLEEKIKKEQILFKYFSSEHIGEGKLIRDITDLIDYQISDNEKVSVIVDNIFELRCKYPLLENTNSFLTAMLEVFKTKGVDSFIIDGVEVGEGRNPLQKSLCAGLCSNVFLLRHVEFQSRSRHVFSVLKLVGKPTPECLWGLEEIRKKNGERLLEPNDLFALYTNVLSGKPEPAKIKMTLFNDFEGSPFHNYLRSQAQALRRSYGDLIEDKYYGPQEYERIKNVLALEENVERGDCHIVALDEFWLNKLIKKDALEDISQALKSSPSGSQYTDRMQYVSAAHDIALYSKYRDHQEEDVFKKYFAVPARNNCGVICCDPQKVNKIVLKNAPNPDVEMQIQKWLDFDPSHKLTWKHLIEFKKELDKGTALKEEGIDTFFTFCMDFMESSVSFILEVLLSFCERDKLISEQGEITFENCAQGIKMALATIIQLLDVKEISLIANGIMSRKSALEPKALFSRQWMSTLGCLRARYDDKGFQSQNSNLYFLFLRPFELPISTISDCPTPVSGTWYLGLLKNSIAPKVGARIIEQFTTAANELYKLNNFIGLPVRSSFYRNESNTEMIGFRLPYSKRYADVAKLQSEYLGKPEPEKDYNKFYGEVMQSIYPFYRMTIKHYQDVAPILWRLLVHSADQCLKLEKAERKDENLLIKEMAKPVDLAIAEYKSLCEAMKSL